MRIKRDVTGTGIEVIFDDSSEWHDGAAVVLVWRRDLYDRNDLYEPVVYTFTEWAELLRLVRLAGCIDPFFDMNRNRTWRWSRTEDGPAITVSPEEAQATSRDIIAGRLDLPSASDWDEANTAVNDGRWR